MESQNKIWKFVNSKIGLLLIGFLLTTVLGTLLTYQIEQAAWEHKIRFNQLQEDRGVVIRAIYQKIVEVELDLSNYENLNSTKRENLNVSVHELRRLFEKSRIYFTQDLSGEIGKVCNYYEKAIESENSAKIKRDKTDSEIVGAADRIVAAASLVVAKDVKRKLEEEFRKILGVY